jgi:hypothetical protein
VTVFCGAQDCPGDKVDSLYVAEFKAAKVKTIWDAWGSSYLSVWAVETLRAKHGITVALRPIPPSLGGNLAVTAGP